MQLEKTLFLGTPGHQPQRPVIKTETPLGYIPPLPVQLRDGPLPIPFTTAIPNLLRMEGRTSETGVRLAQEVNRVEVPRPWLNMVLFRPNRHPLALVRSGNAFLFAESHAPIVGFGPTLPASESGTRKGISSPIPIQLGIPHAPPDEPMVFIVSRPSDADAFALDHELYWWSLGPAGDIGLGRVMFQASNTLIERSAEAVVPFARTQPTLVVLTQRP